MNYVLENNKKLTGEITIELTDGFEFTPKINSTKKIKKIIIYNEDLICNCINRKFMNKYKKIVALVISLLQSEASSDSDFEIVLNEVLKQKEIVLYKYQKYLKKEKEKDYLKKLIYLETEIKNKYMLNKMMQEEKGISR